MKSKSLVLLLSLVAACIGFSGCSTSPVDGKRYVLLAEIPVVRPSEIGIARVTSGAIALAKKYKANHSVADWTDFDPVTRRKTGNYRLKLHEPVTDELWLGYIRNRMLRKRGDPPPDWNYDRGTTVRIYYYRYWGGVSNTWNGHMAFMKGDEVVERGWVPRRENIADYYRDMEKLGFFIP